MLVVEQTLQPWPNGLKDTCDNVSEDISELLEGIIDDIYLPSAPTIELTPPSLESEVDKVTDYLNEINETKEEISEVTLKWAGPGKEVFVAGSFSNWEGLTMTNEEKDKTSQNSDQNPAEPAQSNEEPGKCFYSLHFHLHIRVGFNAF